MSTEFLGKGESIHYSLLCQRIQLEAYIRAARTQTEAPDPPSCLKMALKLSDRNLAVNDVAADEKR